MQWNWANKQQSKQSVFFSGTSITSQTEKSLFGRFIEITQKYFKDTSNEILQLLDVPKVIVIGAESSGKSSLLENIIKCPVFPRNTNICTKQPIRLILKTALSKSDSEYKITYNNHSEFIDDKNQIMDRITNIMSKLEPDTISEDVINIEITDVNLPNFEFYDLPGIRAYPPKMAEQTTKLAEKYLQQHNTIVLCVVPATIPRMTSYSPIALIKKHNKENNTIITLTMADRIQPINIYDLLIKRLINQTDEFDQNEFAGCTSIINRAHSDVNSLEDNDLYETEWFNTNILQGIPPDFPEDNIQLIKRNLSISNLVLILDNIYNQFIKINWIPNNIKILNTKLIEIEYSIFDLGFDPSNKLDTFNDVYYNHIIPTLNQQLELSPSKIIYTNYKDNQIFLPIDIINGCVDHIQRSDTDYHNIISNTMNKLNSQLATYDNIEKLNIVRFENFNKKIICELSCNFDQIFKQLYMDSNSILIYYLITNCVFDNTVESYNDSLNKLKTCQFIKNLKKLSFAKSLEIVLSKFQSYDEYLNLSESDQIKNNRFQLYSARDDVKKTIDIMDNFNNEF